MPKFYLIDESLCDVGGHHYGFARLVLGAAAEFGYDVVLATHRSFGDAGFLPPSSQILRLYAKRLYDDPCLMPCGEVGGEGVRGRELDRARSPLAICGPAAAMDRPACRGDAIALRASAARPRRPGIFRGRG